VLHCNGKLRTLIPLAVGGHRFSCILKTIAVKAMKTEERPMTVFLYVNTSKQVGDAEHVKVFATTDAAETWFEANDPEGVAFQYEVLE
jgi:hypothetical protein